MQWSELGEECLFKRLESYSITRDRYEKGMYNLYKWTGHGNLGYKAYLG